MNEPKDDNSLSKRILNPKGHFFLPARHKLSPATSKSINFSLNKTQEVSVVRRKARPTLNSQKVDIFFNNTKKYNYMKQIIDKYFEETKRDKFYSKNNQNPEEIVSKQYSTIIPRIHKTKEISPEQKNQNQLRSKIRMSISKRKQKPHKEENQEELASTIDKARPIVSQNTSYHNESLTKSISFASINNSLPPIDEMFEDRGDQDQSQIQYESVSLLNQSTIIPQRQEKLVLFQNQIYFVQMVIINGKPNHRLKIYKEKGEQILKRQLRALRMGIASIWISYKYNPKALISSPVKPIKELLFKAKKMDIDAKFYTLKTKTYYKKLMANSNEELIRVVRQFCEYMKKWEGKILNNKVNTSNFFIAKNDNLRLGEWGFASFREKHLIQNVQFQNRIEPIIKSQTDWFVPPEYLAPEILRAILYNEDTDLMSFGAAPDIWSLGITIFEILTVIPIWIPQKCVIQGKNMVPRAGVLAVPEQDLNKILKKDEKLTYTLHKMLEQDYSEQNFNLTLINAMLRCLEYKPEMRPTYQQLAQLLK